MLFLHKTKQDFMFYTPKWLRRFNKWKLYLEDELIENIKLTEDFKFGLIEQEEVIMPEPIKEEIKEEIIIEEKKEEVKPKRKTWKK